MVYDERVELISSSDYDSLKNQPTDESINGKQESLFNSKIVKRPEVCLNERISGCDYYRPCRGRRSSKTNNTRPLVRSYTLPDRLIRAENDPHFSMFGEGGLIALVNAYQFLNQPTRYD